MKGETGIPEFQQSKFKLNSLFPSARLTEYDKLAWILKVEGSELIIIVNRKR